jgi:hypothetical protein
MPDQVARPSTAEVAAHVAAKDRCAVLHGHYKLSGQPIKSHAARADSGGKERAAGAINSGLVGSVEKIGTRADDLGVGLGNHRLGLTLVVERIKHAAYGLQAGAPLCRWHE